MHVAVSDVAHGGQVLMDLRTFEAIKDRLEELGAVGPSGLDHRKMRHYGWWHWMMCVGWRGGSGGCVMCLYCMCDAPMYCVLMCHALMCDVLMCDVLMCLLHV